MEKTSALKMKTWGELEKIWISKILLRSSFGLATND
jgi:hypothetical protein